MAARLDAKVCVSGQITPGDVARFAATGVTDIICNRPDAEVPPSLAAAAIAAACKDAGVRFHDNPLGHGGLDLATIDAQAAAIEGAQGEVLAYCASGTRSSVLWAFARARSRALSPAEIEAALTEAGYAFPGIAGRLAAVQED